MFAFIDSLSFTPFLLINIVIILGCVYYIIKEKQTNKLYIPLLYLAPIGSLILVLNKYISTKQDLVEFASITKIFVYGYVGVFFIVIILLSAIGLKRENDPNINKPMIRSGLFLLLLCAGGLILILTIRGN